MKNKYLKPRFAGAALIATVAVLTGVAFLASCKIGETHTTPNDGDYWDTNFDVSKKHVKYNNPAGETLKDRIILIYAQREVIVNWKDGKTWEQLGMPLPPITGIFNPGDPNYNAEEGIMYADDGNGGQLAYYDYAVNSEGLTDFGTVEVKFYMPSFADYNLPPNTVPTRPGQMYYDFKGWSKVPDYDSAVREPTGKLKNDLSGVLAPSAGAEFPASITGGYNVYALWEENNLAADGKARLEDSIKEAAENSEAGTTLGLKDEYIIGNGVVTEGNFDADVIALATSLTALVEEGEALLAGTVRYAEQTIDELDENGDQKIEQIQYITYEFAEMARVADAMNVILNDPRWNAEAFLPTVITLVYAKYPQATPATGTFKHWASAVANKPRAQSVTIGKDGYYEIELWGASGGHLWSKNGATAFGGKGGHVKGKVYLTKGRVLKFFIGGEGEGTATPTYDAQGVFKHFEENTNIVRDTQKSGGWNGGGNGGGSRDTSPKTAAGSGGGGAADVRYVANITNDANGTYGWDWGVPIKAGNSGSDAGNTNSVAGPYIVGGLNETRIMVAAGGGGAGQAAEIISSYWPGIRGGWADDLHVAGAVKGGGSNDNGSSSTSPNFLYSVPNGANNYKYYGQAFTLTMTLPATYTLNESDSGQWVSLRSLSPWEGQNGQDWVSGASAYEGSGGGGGGFKGGLAIVKYDKSIHDNGGNNPPGLAFRGTASGGGGSNYYATTIVTKTVSTQNEGDADKDPRINHSYGNGHAIIRYVQ